MAPTSLPSIHEMFPDHLMRGDFRRPRTNSNSDYRCLAPSPTPSMCSSGCPCASASSSATVDRASPFHRFPAPPSKSAELPSKALDNDDHSGPYSYDLLRSALKHPAFRERGPLEYPLRPGSSTAPYCYSDSRSRLLSSDTALPRSYPCDTNGGNSLEPNFEDDDCPVEKSMASIDGPLLVNNNLDALGRKHVCPTCFKRFNRPSSLRIHLNTHTGATPFKCPWPKCGREFNVNSNMRRHYRNHLGSPRGQGQFPGANELRPLAPAAIVLQPVHHSSSHPAMDDHPQSRFRPCRPRQQLPPASVRSLSSSPSISEASSSASRMSSPTSTDFHTEHSSQPKYSASKPYSASLSDGRVRTTLRPAFM